MQRLVYLLVSAAPCAVAVKSVVARVEGGDGPSNGDVDKVVGTDAGAAWEVQPEIAGPAAQRSTSPTLPVPSSAEGVRAESPGAGEAANLDDRAEGAGEVVREADEVFDNDGAFRQPVGMAEAGSNPLFAAIMAEVLSNREGAPGAPDDALHVLMMLSEMLRIGDGDEIFADGRPVQRVGSPGTANGTPAHGAPPAESRQCLLHDEIDGIPPALRNLLGDVGTVKKSPDRSLQHGDRYEIELALGQTHSLKRDDFTMSHLPTGTKCILRRSRNVELYEDQEKYWNHKIEVVKFIENGDHAGDYEVEKTTRKSSKSDLNF